MKKILFIFTLFSFHVFGQTLTSINHDGLDRVYSYYVPTNWDQSQEVPLLFVLHGLTQTGEGVMDITGFNEIAETNNFIVCYPSGISNAWNANMNVSVSSADDKGLIEKLALLFQNDFNTNPQKQYLCGFSNGGFMSHKMACESDMCFAAIATVSGNMSDTVYANCNPKFPTSVLHIHGTADPVVTYFGSITTGVSVAQTMEKWQQFLSCDPNPSSVDLPNPSILDLSTASRETYANCVNSSLEHIKVSGGGHQWPGIATVVGGVGNVNMDFYSPQIIWDFLQDKSCPINGMEENNLAQLSVYPNPFETTISIKNANEFETYELFTINGCKIRDYSIALENINLSELPSGVYLLKLNVNGKKSQFIKINKL